MALTKGKNALHLLPKKDFSSSRAVIFWLLVSLATFYAVFYVTASLVHGIFKLDNFDGTLPFHYQSYGGIFTNSTKWGTQPFLGDFVTLECAYFLSTFAFLTFLRQRLWDFAITVTVVHCAITCAVNVSFPLIWEWWVCVLIGLVVTIAFGQLLNEFLTWKKNGSFTPEKSATGAVS